ncbi:MAG: DUF1559 family PulG-like putative transporter [Candidatus Zipacnadales bacterium]
MAAILFPVFAKAREKARQTSCLSNVKQLTLGYLMYLQDYDETFTGRFIGAYNPSTWTPGQPTSRYSWASLIQPYVKNTQIYICPSYTTRWTTYDVSGNYGYNLCALGVDQPRTPPVLLAQVNRPAQTVLLGGSVCCGLKGTGSDPRNCLYIGPGTNTTGVYPDECHPRMRVHNDGINLGFVDGHARWFGFQQIPRGSFWARN